MFIYDVGHCIERDQGETQRYAAEDKFNNEFLHKIECC